MSGYANFNNLTEQSKIREIPLIKATPENTKLLGSYVDDFDEQKVTFETLFDPKTCRPYIIPKEVTEGKFDVWNTGVISHAENHAVGSGLYNVAKLMDNKMYVREVNYHPEGSQIVFPEDKKPFVMILGTKILNISAYMFDGTKGFEIDAGIWHQPPVLLERERMTFKNKQPKSHICVLYDSVMEDNVWMMCDLNKLKL